MRNSSGFAGYSVSSVYPDMGDGVTQTLATVPDIDEQESLSAQEPDQKATPAVNPQNRTQLWVMLGAAVLLVVLFAK